MAFPLYINSTVDNYYIKRSSNTDVVQASHFPVSASSNLYFTNLPDPIYYITSSVTQSIAQPLPGTTTVFLSTVKNFRNTQVHSPFYLLGTRTAVAASGPTIDYGTNSATKAINIAIASTATALTRGIGGTGDGLFRSVAAGLAVANTTYPTTIQGVTYNDSVLFPTNVTDFFIGLASENTDRVTINSGSIYLNRFIGYSSSLAPVTSSRPLNISGSSIAQIPAGNLISSSVLFDTASLWQSQSLATDVANTSNTAYVTVFTTTGLTNGKRYLANLYLIGRSAAAATGFRMRVITGSNYLGSLFTPTSTTAYAIQNSADGNNITSITAGTWPTLNTNFLVYGEYSFVKTAAGDPQVQILSETGGTAVTAGSGSVLFYRVIE
jgi:hypothetical protein